MSDPRFENIGSPIVKLIEELSELIQELCKADRFGWTNYHPKEPYLTNRERVEKEWRDVLRAKERLNQALENNQGGAKTNA